MTTVINLLPDWYAMNYVETGSVSFWNTGRAMVAVLLRVLNPFKKICYPINKLSDLIPPNDPIAIWEGFSATVCLGSSVIFTFGPYFRENSAIVQVLEDNWGTAIWAAGVFIFGCAHIAGLLAKSFTMRGAALALSTFAYWFTMFVISVNRNGFTPGSVILLAAGIWGLVAMRILRGRESSQVAN